MNKARNKPKQLRAQLTVDTMLQATEELIKEFDFDRISTNKIAKRAGISIGSLYQFFPNKEALFEAVKERMIEGIAREAIQIMAELKNVSAVVLAEALIDKVFERAREHPELVPVISKFLLQPNGNNALVKLQESIIIVGRQLLLSNKAVIEFDDAHTTAYVLSNMCVLLLCQFYAQPQSYVTEEQFKRELLTIISARMRKKER